MKKSLLAMLLDTAGLGLAILIIAGVAARTATVAGMDRNQTCVANLYPVSAAFLEYVQDYDEKLPPYKDADSFQNALHPYFASQPVNISSYFVCPATRNIAYVYNLSLAAKSTAALTTELDVTPVMSDAVPHPDGLSTVGFLDGHVERGGIEQPDVDTACVNRSKALARGISDAILFPSFLPILRYSFPLRPATRHFRRHLWRTFTAAVSSPALSRATISRSIRLSTDII